MTTLQRDAVICDDCLIVYFNDDDSGIESDERTQAVRDGLAHVERFIFDNWEDGSHEIDFSTRGCPVCGQHLAGRRSICHIIWKGDQ